MTEAGEAIETSNSVHGLTLASPISSTTKYPQKAVVRVQWPKIEF